MGGVESDRRSKALDGGLRISRNKCKVASEPMTVVRIGGREAHGALQRRQLRTRSKNACCELCRGQENIDAGEGGDTSSELPPLPALKWSRHWCQTAFSTSVPAAGASS